MWSLVKHRNWVVSSLLAACCGPQSGPVDSALSIASALVASADSNPCLPQARLKKMQEELDEQQAQAEQAAKVRFSRHWIHVFSGFLFRASSFNVNMCKSETESQYAVRSLYDFPLQLVLNMVDIGVVLSAVLSSQIHHKCNPYPYNANFFLNNLVRTF